jgi:peroxiredoxin
MDAGTSSSERTTFVIDPDGIVTEVLRKVKPADHDERVS